MAEYDNEGLKNNKAQIMAYENSKGIIQTGRRRKVVSGGYMSCVNKCCDIFCSRCKQTRGAQRAYRCLGCMCRWLCEKLLRRKRVFAESDTKITIKGVFENCGVGDLVFISQLVAFDSTCKVSILLGV